MSISQVLMDGFYASLGCLKLIHEYGWIFVTRLKSNRLVSTAPGKENRHPLKEIEIPEEGRILHLKGFGMVKVFLIDFQNGNKEYIGTNDLTLPLEDAREAAAQRWRMEENITWYEARRKIISDALFSYLKSPLIPLPVKT